MTTTTNELTNDIMRTLASFAHVADANMTSKTAWLNEANAHYEQAKQQLDSAHSATEIEEAADARRSAWAEMHECEKWVKWAQGYQGAVKLITQAIQGIIEASQDCETTEAEDEDLSELSVQDEAFPA